jgi:opine dehydrogenase
MAIKKIAVLGAGNGGQAAAADLTLRGFDVSLFDMPSFEQNLRPIVERGGIEIQVERRKEIADCSSIPTTFNVGVASEGFAKIDRVTSDIQKAVNGVDLILVATTTAGHEMMMKLCAPYLKGGQTIVFLAGNASTLVLSRRLKEMGIHQEVTLAETSCLPYNVRRIGPSTVRVFFSRKWWCAAFPGKKTPQVLQMLEGIFDLWPAVNVLHSGLINPNFMNHPAGTLLNIGAIENMERWGGDFHMYSMGVTPSVYRVMKAMDHEKLSLCKKLGYPEISISEFHTYTSWAFGFSSGPNSMKHRYVTEDIPVGAVMYSSLGKMLGVPTPVSDAMIAIANAVNETDYYQEGRTVERLGLAGMSPEELNRYLETGIKTK